MWTSVILLIRILWQWSVVGVLSTFIIGAAINALYGNDFSLARILFLLGIFYLVAKTVSWDEIRNHSDKVWPVLFTAVVGICLLVASLYWTARSESAVTTSIPSPAKADYQSRPAGYSSATPSVEETPHQFRRPVAKTSTKSVPKQDVGSRSVYQSNSGGINVQQGITGDNSSIINSPITVGHVPKDIASSDMLQLTNFLSHADVKATVEVIADQYSSSEPFPEKFFQALESAGWKLASGGVDNEMMFGPPGPQYHGARILTYGDPIPPGEGVYIDRSSPTLYIGQALRSFGIQTVVERSRAQPEGKVVVIFQGGFPDAQHP